MSIKNFVPLVWAKQFEEELDRNLVFKEDCNTKYEGELKKVGDSVKILTPGKPTIRTFNDGKLHTLDEPENVTGTSITLPINMVSDYHFTIDDLDKRQASGDLKSVYMTEAAQELSNEMDSYIAKFASSKNTIQEKPSAAITADTILDTINGARTKLFQNDVALNTELVLTATPKFIEILTKAYEKLDTDNSEMMKNGRVGRYHNVTIKMSNNVYNDGTYDYIMLRTRRALAFVNQVTHSEAYRPEKGFADALKGFVAYDGTWVRPKENVTLAVKYA